MNAAHRVLCPKAHIIYAYAFDGSAISVFKPEALGVRGVRIFLLIKTPAVHSTSIYHIVSMNLFHFD